MGGSSAFEQLVEQAYEYPLVLHVHDILFYFQDCTMKDDVLCVTAGPDCKYKTYEMTKLNWLKTQLVHFKKKRKKSPMLMTLQL